MKPDCIIWAGDVDKDDYGLVTDPESGRRMRATRWVWMRKVGPIPPRMFILHRCDFPRCVNVDHLFLGTHAENMADMTAKRRRHGERNPAAKMTLEIVERIRARSAQGASCYQLAREFGIGKSQAWNIATGKSWV